MTPLAPAVERQRDRVRREIKALIACTMGEQGVTRAELARRLHVAPMHVTRLLAPDHQARLESYEAAMRAMGFTLDLRIERPR